MLWVGLLLGLVALSLRGYLAGRLDTRFWSARPRAALAALPDLVAAERPVLLVGTSHVGVAHVPDTFDRAYRSAGGRPVQSINLGIGFLTGELLVQTARRLVDEIGDHRLEIIVVEYSPILEVEERFQEAAAAQEPSFATIPPARYILEEARVSPSRAATLAARRWVTLGVSPGELSTDLRRSLFPPPSWWQRPASGPRPIREVLQERFALVFKTWDPARRGGPSTSAAFIAQADPLVVPGPQRELFTRKDQKFHLSELHISRSGVDSMIAAVRMLAPRARHIVVVVPPWNSAIIRPSVTRAGYARAASAFVRIRREAGVCLIDLMDSDRFETGDFFDYVHLGPRGAEKFSTLMAEKLASWELARHPADCSGLD